MSRPTHFLPRRRHEHGPGDARASRLPGWGTCAATQSFPDAARTALADTQLRRNLGHATTVIRNKRAAVVAELDDWEELRRAGEAIKTATMARLDEHLQRLEEQVTARGGVVHWARDANEANRIVTDLVRATGQTEVVKVKSMATQEIGLNEALEAAGIEAKETDLAELIVQLGGDLPVAHPRARHPPQPRGDPRDLPAGDARRGPGAHRRAAAAGHGRPHAPAGAVPAGQGRDLRRQLRASPTRARCSSSSPRATGGCASRCPRR